MTCLSVILRRQWVEHERLIYPLMQVPLAMMADDPQGRLLKPFFRSWAMWIGFAIPVVFMSFFALHNYFPWFPQVVLRSSVDVFRQSIFLTFGLNFLMLGFGYFINTQIGFSLWFFYLLHQLQEGLLFYYGLQDTQAELGWWTEPGMGHQMMGALIVLVLSGLWIGRPHFKRVLKKAWHRDAQVEDGDEIMSYRAAVCGAACGIAGMWLWLWQTGIPAWIVPVFLFAGLVIFIGHSPSDFRDRAADFQSQYDPSGLCRIQRRRACFGRKGHDRHRLHHGVVR